MAMKIHVDNKEVHGTLESSFTFDNHVRSAAVVLNGWELLNPGEWTVHQFVCLAQSRGIEDKTVNYSLRFNFDDDSGHSDGGKVYFSIIADLETA